MKRIRRVSLSLLSILLSGGLVYGQGATTHVFPQVADGTQADGSSYFSLLSVMNLSGSPANCTLTTVGMPASRWALTTTPTIVSGGTYLNLTTEVDALATGYATLTCSQPVQASLMYSLSGSSGVRGMAAVFSAPPIRSAAFPMFVGVGWRYGVAIANPSPSAISVVCNLSLPNGTSSTMTVQIPPLSQYVRFVDEIMPVPASNGVDILAISSPSTFNLTGLLFNGSVFTTIVPATTP